MVTTEQILQNHELLTVRGVDCRASKKNFWGVLPVYYTALLRCHLPGRNACDQSRQRSAAVAGHLNYPRAPAVTICLALTIPRYPHNEWEGRGTAAGHRYV